MKIRNVVHKGLRRLIEHDDASGLAPPIVEKVRNILTFLEAMNTGQELRDVPVWKAHVLARSRKGTWSLTVTRNWRITSPINQPEQEIHDLDFEDYH
jgi:toxin HigB-1